MNSAIQPPLDYAPAPERQRRKLWLALACVAITIVAFFGWHFRARVTTAHYLWSQSRLIERLMTHSAPADQVAWDGTLGAAGPDEWAKFWPPSGLRVNSKVNIFVHGRTTPAGRRMLVVIDYVPLRSGHAHLAATIVEPGHMTRGSRHNGPFVAMADDGLFSGTTPPKLYAGQADPNDPSRFTIRYELGTERGVLEGVVTDPPPTAPTWEFGGVQITRHPDAPHAP